MGTFEARDASQIQTAILNEESDVALNGGCGVATYYPPEQGGDFLIGHTFPDDVMTRDLQRERIAGEKRSVRVEGLELLSTTDTTWFTLTGVTPFHGSNHWGTPGLNAAISIMAHYYFDHPDTAGRQITLNDMSLEFGGMFDICGTWNWHDTCTYAGYPGGHQEHRQGLNADIKRITTDGNAVRQTVLNDGIQRAIGAVGANDAYCNWHGTGESYHCHFVLEP